MTAESGSEGEAPLAVGRSSAEGAMAVWRVALQSGIWPRLGFVRGMCCGNDRCQGYGQNYGGEAASAEGALVWQSCSRPVSSYRLKVFAGVNLEDGL